MNKLINTYLGQYLVTEVISGGELSTIYKAYQPLLERYVVIKVLPPVPPSYDPDYGTHFKLAAQEIAKVHHPNILRIYDYQEQEGLHYLVLQYIEGGLTLADKLGKPLDWTMVLQVASQVFDALNYAHQRNVIHGDIKPPNILLSSSGWPMLTDFGIVKRIADQQRLTLSSVAVGTPPYMAPEQATGQPIDERTDIYALGVVLYEMLTGRLPFDAATPMEVLHKHVYESPLPPQQLNPDITSQVERTLLRALAKDPNQRYQSVAEMAKDFLHGTTQRPPNDAQNQRSNLYQAGVHAFAAGRWDVAIEQLSQLVALGTSYEDATDLLAAARDVQERTKRAAQQQLDLVRERHQSTTDAHSQLPTSTPATAETTTVKPSTDRTTTELFDKTAPRTSALEANKAIVRRWIEEMWNSGNVAIIDELVAPSSNAAAQAIRWRTGFPDTSFTIDELIAEGEKVAVRWSAQGIRPGMSRSTVSANEPMPVPGMSIYRIVDGKITESWMHWPMYFVGT